MKYERELDALRLAVEGVLHELVVGARSSGATRHALLPHTDQLAAFLGRRCASNALKLEYRPDEKELEVKRSHDLNGYNLERRH